MIIRRNNKVIKDVAEYMKIKEEELILEKQSLENNITDVLNNYSGYDASVIINNFLSEVNKINNILLNLDYYINYMLNLVDYDLSNLENAKKKMDTLNNQVNLENELIDTLNVNQDLIGGDINV